MKNKIIYSLLIFLLPLLLMAQDSSSPYKKGDGFGTYNIGGGGSSFDPTAIANDVKPSVDATYDIGSTSFGWKNLYLENGATDGGACYFDGSNTSFLKSSTDGLTLSVGGFTSILSGTDASANLGSTSYGYKALYLDNAATDGGALYFDGSNTSYAKSSADGTTLEFGGFTAITVPVGATIDGKDVSTLGTGDVSSIESSSVDNTLVRMNSTTGKSIQKSNIVIDDSDNMTAVNSIRTKVSPVYNVLEWGLIGDDSTDNATNFATLITALVASGSGRIYFPAGTYRFNSAQSFSSVGDLEIYGDSKNVSKISFVGYAATNPWSAFGDYIYMHDLWFVTENAYPRQAFTTASIYSKFKDLYFTGGGVFTTSSGNSYNIYENITWSTSYNPDNNDSYATFRNIVGSGYWIVRGSYNNFQHIFLTGGNDNLSLLGDYNTIIDYTGTGSTTNLSFDSGSTNNTLINFRGNSANYGKVKWGSVVSLGALQTVIGNHADYGTVIKENVTTVNAATYNIVSDDNILNVTYTATAAVTNLQLMTIQVHAGRTLIIKDAGGNAAVNNITITTEGAETIDGAATLVISTNYGVVRLYSDGTNWFTW